jgi:cytochrome P450
MLEPFGPNVVSLDGEKWKAHLAITLPPVAADNVLGLLWEETYRQVDIMASTWNRAGEVPSLKGNIYSLTMNTMLSVGFGKQSERTEGSDAVSKGHVLSLVEAMYTVVMHLPHILLLAKPVLKFLKPEASTGYTELERYMTELLKREKDLLSKNHIKEHSSRETLMTAMLRSNLNSQSDGLSLTDNEVMGNMFIFLLAGYDTTANTMIFCSMILALYPDIQNRLIEEVDRIWAEAAREGRSELSHTHDMPKFRYMIAFMVRRGP